MKKIAYKIALVSLALVVGYAAVNGLFQQIMVPYQMAPTAYPPQIYHCGWCNAL